MKHNFFKYLIIIVFFMSGSIIAQDDTIGGGGNIGNGDIGNSDGNGGIGIGDNTNTAYGLPTVIPPSPTVAALMQFEEVPVDLYSGIPSITIPIFSSPLDQNMGFNLALSYHPEGVKIDNRSGWTGTGWSLTGLGAISRTVIGYPDEHQKGVLTSNINGHLSYEEYDQNIINPETGTVNYDVIVDNNRFSYEASKGRLDAEPDIFQFNAFGISGRFLVMNTPTGRKAVLLGDDQKLKIDFDDAEAGIPHVNGSGGGFRFRSFTITDQNGYQYIFNSNARESTYNLSHSFPTNDDLTIPEQYTNDSAWNLTSVKNYAGQTLITIDYASSIEHYNTPTIYNVAIAGTNPAPSAIENPQDLIGPITSSSYSEIIVQTRKVTKVTIRNEDLITIDFESSGNHPEYDYSTMTVGEEEPFVLTEGHGILERIIINEGGHENKSFTLNYNSPSNGNRLILQGVTELAGDESLPYTFEYNGSAPVFGTLGKDYWGYSNGISAGNENPAFFSTTLANRVANPSAMTAGVLQSITYPTGGVKEFEFESNSFGNINNLSHSPQPRTRTFSNINIDVLGHTDLGVIYINDLDMIDEELNIQNLELEIEIDGINYEGSEDDFGLFLERVEGTPGDTYNCPCIRTIGPNPESDFTSGGPFGQILLDENGDPILDEDGNFILDIDETSQNQPVDYGIDNGFYDPADFPTLVNNDDGLADFFLLKFDGSSSSGNGNGGLGNEGSDDDGVNDNEEAVGQGEPLDIIKSVSKRKSYNLSCSGEGCFDPDHSGYFRVSVGNVNGVFPSDIVSVTIKITDYYPPNPNNPDADFVPVYGGGMRIKEVRFTDQDSIKRKTQYDYSLFDNPERTSGVSSSSYRIRTQSTFKNAAFFAANGPNLESILAIPYFKASSSAVVMPAKGGYVGYSNVRVLQIDDQGLSNGESHYTYTTSGFSGNASPAIAPYAPSITNDYSYGNLLKQEIFDDQGRIVSSSVNNYAIEGRIVGKGQAIRFRDDSCPYVHTADTYEVFRQSICLSDNPQVTGSPCFGVLGGACDNSEFEVQMQSQFFINRYNIISGRSLLESSTSTTYFYDDAGNQSSSVQTSTYGYNDFNNQISEQSVSVSEEPPLITKYYYPADEEVNASDEENILDGLVGDHRLSELIKTESYQGDNLLFTEQRDFAHLGGAPRVKFIKTQKQGGPLEDRLEYINYDNYGNPLEARKTDGTRVIYIWGYYNMYALAEITNASYQNLPSSVINLINEIRSTSDTENTVIEEQELRELLNNLRNHPVFANSLMTTTTYDPIIGLTSKTDSRGYTMYYQYDDLNRLKRVMDQNGKVYSSNEYNYRNN